jgi:hypothetical protein
MAERVARASACPRPPSATSADAANPASSIVRFSFSWSSLSNQRTAYRDRRPGSFSTTSAVNASDSSRLIRPSSREAISATSTFPFSIARRKIDLECPCAVTALPVGPDGKASA